MNDGIDRMILTGYANGDLHRSPLQPRQNASDAAALETAGIGSLTNAGFRVLVASVWSNDEKRTAGVDFVTVWEENQGTVIVKNGDRVATSHELYTKLQGATEDFNCSELVTLCRRLRI